MQSLGLIETKGMLAAIEAADAMLKAADVGILGKIKVGGGRMNVSVTGDVAAVKAAVDAGMAAVDRLGSGLLLSGHVIARPHEELETVIGGTPPMGPDDGGAWAERTGPEAARDEKRTEPASALTEEAAEGVAEEASEETAEEAAEEAQPASPGQLASQAVFAAPPDRRTLDRLAAEAGGEAAVKALISLKAAELRTLAKEYPELELAGRDISKASKTLLLTAFQAHFNHTEQ
ncbi:BMC domain-containing protein [Enterocloster aldenensis]|uniref:BMC domain-containing protein n=1 Tax=Enterocloster aldenensis TaxID=358742 RepID=UPI000E4FE96E|nr:BMC domain-containing protein [Enterocloster aldenensis]